MEVRLSDERMQLLVLDQFILLAEVLRQMRQKHFFIFFYFLKLHKIFIAILF